MIQVFFKHLHALLRDIERISRNCISGSCTLSAVLTLAYSATVLTVSPLGVVIFLSCVSSRVAALDPVFFALDSAGRSRLSDSCIILSDPLLTGRGQESGASDEPFLNQTTHRGQVTAQDARFNRCQLHGSPSGNRLMGTASQVCNSGS